MHQTLPPHQSLLLLFHLAVCCMFFPCHFLALSSPMPLWNLKLLEAPTPLWCPWTHHGRSSISFFTCHCTKHCNITFATTMPLSLSGTQKCLVHFHFWNHQKACKATFQKPEVFFLYSFLFYFFFPLLCQIFIHHKSLTFWPLCTTMPLSGSAITPLSGTTFHKHCNATLLTCSHTHLQKVFLTFFSNLYSLFQVIAADQRKAASHFPEAPDKAHTTPLSRSQKFSSHTHFFSTSFFFFFVKFLYITKSLTFYPLCTTTPLSRSATMPLPEPPSISTAMPLYMPLCLTCRHTPSTNISHFLA